MLEYDLPFYFEPIDFKSLNFSVDKNLNRMGDRLRIYQGEDFPDIEGVKIALIGVEEERNSHSIGCKTAPDEIRKQFYQLFYQDKMPLVADLGNVKLGESVNDTYVVVADIIGELLQASIIVVILGGSQDLTYANYLAYKDLNKIINLTAIDPKFDLDSNEKERIDDESYLGKIILSQPNYLFNFSNLGYQTYFVDNKDIELIDKLLFDCHRLGLARQDLADCEPIIRSADMVSVDMTAVCSSSAPGADKASPNGFSAAEICTLSYYAGANDRLSSFGIYQYNPLYDINNQSALLIGEMIWYFIWGYTMRTNDVPNALANNFKKYTVSLFDGIYQIIFYRSKTSSLWWMEIPMEEGENTKFKRHYIIPCSEKDYQTACQNDVPLRWLQSYKKIKS